MVKLVFVRQIWMGAFVFNLWNKERGANIATVCLRIVA